MSFRIIVITILCAFGVLRAEAQEIPSQIEIGPARLSLDEELRITVTIYGDKYEVSDFPDIAGFLHGQKSLKHGDMILEGKKVSYHIYTQAYKPIVVGDFLVPSLDIEVNGKVVKNEPLKVFVEDEDEYEMEELKESAVLMTQIKDSKIFVGEGLAVKVSFYLANNTSNWQFPKDISEQIEKIAKQIKPDNSLESRKVFTEIPQRTETIKGVKYNVYDLFQSVYYPLSSSPIQIPQLELRMQRGSGFEVLKSKSKKVSVNELPPHPLREKVAVGKFRLKELIEGNQKKATGESFVYKIIVEGQGFVNVATFDRLNNITGIDFYESGVNVEQEEGKNKGEKAFTYKVLPKIAGDYPFKDYFSLIYFDADRERYDTLYAKTKINVTGAEVVASEGTINDIYSGIEQIDTSKNEFEIRKFLKHFANIILVIMAIVLTYIRRRK